MGSGEGSPVAKAFFALPGKQNVGARVVLAAAPILVGVSSYVRIVGRNAPWSTPLGSGVDESKSTLQLTGDSAGLVADLLQRDDGLARHLSHLLRVKGQQHALDVASIRVNLTIRGSTAQFYHSGHTEIRHENGAAKRPTYEQQRNRCEQECTEHLFFSMDSSIFNVPLQ